MISTLSNLADRNFILGYVLPVIIAALVLIWLFADVPLIGGLWTTAKSADGFAGLTVVVLGVWTAAVFLLAINHPLYRALEGYWGPLNRRWLKTRQLKAFHRVALKRVALHKLIAANNRAKADYIKATREQRQNFPTKWRYILPTRFGNAIRAFEFYAMDVYSMDSIPGWPRLCGVIPSDYLRFIDNARAQVDFFVNLCLLSALISLFSLFRTAWSGMYIAFDGGVTSDFDWLHLAAALLAAEAAFLCYLGAIMCVPAWGDLVRGAFDLYLPDLAKRLGYVLPDTDKKRREFWRACNLMFLYNEAVLPETWPPPKQPPAA